MESFNSPSSRDMCMLLATRVGTLESVANQLASIETVVIYDSDWNPQADLKCMLTKEEEEKGE